VIDRRAFIGTLAGGLLTAPLAVEAQQPGRVPVVGVLNSGFTGQSTAIAAFRSGLLDVGLVEGQTIELEIRSAGGKPEALPSLAAELVGRRVDSILALGPAALKAARANTDAIPSVAFDLETAPVAGGYARSLARPGGNVTGLFLDHPGLTGKWLGFVREAAPKVRPARSPSSWRGLLILSRAGSSRLSRGPKMSHSLLRHVDALFHWA